MKRLCVFFFLVINLAACAGNPPQWWNPGNRYGELSQTSSVQTAPAAQPAKTVVKEETMDPLPDSSYEEESIAPLPQEEDSLVTTPTAEAAPAATLPAPSVLE